MLGGGPAGLTAAFELTATAELRSQYEVTVYQPGWRLGGKGASGRNRAHLRPHRGARPARLVRLLRQRLLDDQALLRRARRPARRPLANWREAYKPTGEEVIYERFRDRWVCHGVKLPPTPFDPGDFAEHTPLQVLRGAVQGGRGATGASLARRRAYCSRASGQRASLRPPARPGAASRRPARRSPARPAEAARAARAIASRRTGVPARGRARASITTTCGTLFTILDLLATVIGGIRLTTSSPRLERDQRRGADPTGSVATARRSSTLDHLAVPACHLRRVLRLRGGRQEQAQHGRRQGDPGLHPRPALLQRRVHVEDAGGHGRHGVRAHVRSAEAGAAFTSSSSARVTDLHLAKDRGSIETVDVVKQLTIKTASSYEPMCSIRELACWPSEPDWGQIADGASMSARGVNLEREPNPLGRRPRRLSRGRDFDLVVLATPPDVQRAIAGELLADEGNPRYAATDRQQHSVMTQAFQLWIDKHRRGARLALPGRLADELLRRAARHLLLHGSPRATRELARAGPAIDIAYFCGVLAHDGNETQAKADSAASQAVPQYLERDVSDFWPGTRLASASTGTCSSTRRAQGRPAPARAVFPRELRGHRNATS